MNSISITAIAILHEATRVTSHDRTIARCETLCQIKWTAYDVPPSTIDNKQRISILYRDIHEYNKLIKLTFTYYIITFAIVELFTCIASNKNIFYKPSLLNCFDTLPPANSEAFTSFFVQISFCRRRFTKFSPMKTFEKDNNDNKFAFKRWKWYCRMGHVYQYYRFDVQRFLLSESVGINVKFIDKVLSPG